MDYWNTVLKEVKNRKNPYFEKRFVCFPEVQICTPIELEKSQQLKRIYIGETYPGVYLTMRELDCLKYLMRGMTYLGIGNKLGISMRTVETYMKKIKQKLNCSSKKSVIVTANKLPSLVCHMKRCN
ncbi:MAG: helix-turn-helix transcriptional regulator [Coxiellaceae bacterium]|nr:helix-turn-helix transcriptional regulator [Coxiellaceae bacterium]